MLNLLKRICRCLRKYIDVTILVCAILGIILCNIAVLIGLGAHLPLVWLIVLTLVVFAILGLLVVKFIKFLLSEKYEEMQPKKKNGGANQMLEWKKDGWKAVICLAPALLILGVFTFYPIIKTFIVSFFPNYNYLTDVFGSFGFESYESVLTDPIFWRAMGNTAIMVVVSVPLSIIVALIITVLLNSIKKLQGFFQVIFFLPYVTNGIAFGLVFATIFSPMDYGLVNTLLNGLGFESIAWTGTAEPIPYWAGIVVITVYSIWNGLAFKILVFLSGIQGIDKQYYQAAQVDATPKFRVFTKITVPLLSPMILYITITSMMGAFKSYSSVVSLFGESMGNGQDETFITAVGYIYKYFNKVTKMGEYGATLLSKASAAALILFIFILIITAIQMWANKKKVHY